MKWIDPIRVDFTTWIGVKNTKPAKSKGFNGRILTWYQFGINGFNVINVPWELWRS
jgi:hypothetical protein